MEGRYNTRSPAVKRLMREAQELSEPTDQYYAQPLEDNLFEWHFTVRGPADSDFQHGVYHGRIVLPVDYPMKPPSIIWLTPNGRFETNKKICLSISGHHPESWQPSWSIRTALLAIIGFMPTRPGGAIGSLNYTPDERKTLAKRSQGWKCPTCGAINDILLDRAPESKPSTSREAEELAAQIQFQAEKPKGECSVTACAAPSTATPSVATTSSAPTTTSLSSASTSQQQQHQSAGQTQPIATPPASNNNVPPQWNFPAGGAMPPAFPATFPWMGVPPPDVNTALSMIPRFPLPPSQQPAGMLPIQFYPPGFVPFMPAGMPMPGPFPVPPPGMPGFPTMPCTPTMPGYPTMPGTPTMPGYPTMPGTPTMPGYPTMPGTPSTPVSINNSSAASAEAHTTPLPSTAETSQGVPLASASSTAVQSSEREETATRSQPALAGGVAKGGEETKQTAGKGSCTKKELEAGSHRSESDDHFVRTNSEAAGDDSSMGADTYIAHKGRPLQAESKGATYNASLPQSSKCEDGTEQSQPDLPTDKAEGEDESDSGIPPLDLSEAEQTRSSYFERSMGSSVPDLEKKSKPKGLRQRQSATATVPTTDAVSADTAGGATGGGQRIEAASGDTHPRLIRSSYQTPRAFAEARLAHRNAILRQTQPRGAAVSQYDGSFFAMLGLSIVTALILLNRLFDMLDWSLML